MIVFVGSKSIFRMVESIALDSPARRVTSFFRVLYFDSINEAVSWKLIPSFIQKNIDPKNNPKLRQSLKEGPERGIHGWQIRSY